MQSLEITFVKQKKSIEIEYFINDGFCLIESKLDLYEEGNPPFEEYIEKLGSKFEEYKNLHKILKVIDWKFLEIQDYSESFNVQIYSNYEGVSGLILDEIKYIMTEDNEYFISKESNSTSNFVIYENKIYYTDEHNEQYEDGYNLPDESFYTKGNPYEVITIETENFFRKYSKDYENYIQEKYA